MGAPEHLCTRHQIMEKGYRKLLIWQKSDKLAIAIYKETKHFPTEELYGVTSQLRRAALSIPVNIVEGYGRQGKKELRQFINIALGSLAEVEYLNNDNYNKIESLRQEVGNLLWRFYQSL